MSNCTDGRDSVRTGLSELEREGYLVRTLNHTNDGLFNGYNYEIYDTAVYGKSDDGKSVNGNLIIYKTELNKTYSSSSNSHETPNALPEEEKEKEEDFFICEKEEMLRHLFKRSRTEMGKHTLEYLRHYYNKTKKAAESGKIDKDKFKGAFYTYLKHDADCFYFKEEETGVQRVPQNLKEPKNPLILNPDSKDDHFSAEESEVMKLWNDTEESIREEYKASKRKEFPWLDPEGELFQMKVAFSFYEKTIDSPNVQ
jgi:hypothetical protein